MLQTFDDQASPQNGAMHIPLIREALAARGLDAFLVPHEDEHQNEYLPAANERLAWATGFTGSAGAAVIRRDTAVLFVDGRYTLQARAQTDPDVLQLRDVADHGLARYLASELRAGERVGYDPHLHSPDALDRLRTAAAAAKADLAPALDNPLDAAWRGRPDQPCAPARPHGLELAGESSHDKRVRVGAAISKAGADSALITAPTSVAWLLNIRGGDVQRAPVALAQALLHGDGSAVLFIDPKKTGPELIAWLGDEVRLEAPASLEAALRALSGRRILVDPALSSAWCFDVLQDAGTTIVRAADPCIAPRAAKNDVELAGARHAHARDAVALARLLHWLATGGQVSPPDEIEVVTRLESLREATGRLRDLSFDTIAGAGPNGAIVHYRPTRATNRRLAYGELLLVDSGAQYEDGTTDVTRTIAVGPVDPEAQRRFTLVLKGHIALARVRFPAGTPGAALDALARRPLWEAGLDYDHGTGHGVGSYLSVHEGPQRIDKGGALTAQLDPSTRLVPGMIVSNEPGFYKTGAYGIRIENLQAVTPAEPIPGGEREMLGFEVLTLAPIDRRLIDPSLLDAIERGWLDAYHAKVLSAVGPALDPEVRAWLKDACAPLQSVS